MKALLVLYFVTLLLDLATLCAVLFDKKGKK